MSISHNACEEAQERHKLERGASQVGDAASQVAQVGEDASQVGDAAIHCARGSRAGPRWRVGPTFGNSIVGFKCVSCLFIQKEMFEKRASCFSFRKRYFSSIKTMFSKNVFKF